jgi:hypothetical protein
MTVKAVYVEVLWTTDWMDGCVVTERAGLWRVLDNALLLGAWDVRVRRVML